MPPFTIRPLTSSADDFRMLAECFARNDTPRSVAMLRWQYLENPGRRLLVDVAVTEDHLPRLAGVYAVLPVPVVIHGRPALGVQSLDTMTDTEFRGRGLFLRLAAATYARAGDSGARFVYGFPNANSAHGFFGRLGWLRLDPVPFLVRPLRTRYVLRRLFATLGSLPDVRLPAPLPRLPPTHELRRVARFDETHEALWRANVPEIGFAVDRTAEYLNWRLRDKPGENYDVWAMHASGRLLGFVAYVVKEKHGGRVGYVLELMHLPSESAAGRELLRHAIAEMSRQGADLVLAWNLPESPNHRAFRAAGFFDFPARLRPIELHMGVRSLGSTPTESLGARTRWYVSYCDSDTV